MNQYVLFAMSFLGTLSIFVIGIGITAYIAYEEPVSKSAPDQEGIIIGEPGSSHHHNTLLIIIEGTIFRFEKPEQYGADPRAHIHDYSFAEIHNHATNVTLGYFLNTVDMSINATCLRIENHSYCSNQSHTLRMYVNGAPNEEYGAHINRDWEKILITYGTESSEEIEEQIDRVPDPQASPVAEQLPTHVPPELL